MQERPQFRKRRLKRVWPNERVDAHRVLPDNHAIGCQPATLVRRHDGDTTADASQQFRRGEHPVALIANLLAGLVLVRNVDGQDLDRDSAVSANHLADVHANL